MDLGSSGITVEEQMVIMLLIEALQLLCFGCVVGFLPRRSDGFAWRTVDRVNGSGILFINPGTTGQVKFTRFRTFIPQAFEL